MGNLSGSRLRVTRGETFAGESDLEVMCCSECAILYAVPVRLLTLARTDHKTDWCCPNGHSQYFPGETPAKRAERLADELEEQRRRTAATRDLLEHEQRSHAATRGHLTRTRRRVAAGVCPCCNRTFQQLARHMKAQHPGYPESPGHA